MSQAKKAPVSIVMLTYNGLRHTKNCLEHLPRTTSHYELVIVDNASTDGTRKFLKKCADSNPRTKLLFNDENKGFASGCNQGVEAAHNELVCLLNNDTIPSPGWLDALREAMEDGVGAVGAKLLFPDKTIQHCGIVFVFRSSPRPHYLPTHRFLRAPGDIPEASVLEEVPGVTAACLLTTKSVWEKAGGMDEGYVMANFEDVDFNLTIRDMGYRVIYQPKATLIHVEHGTTDLLKGRPEDPMRYSSHNLTRLVSRWNDKLLAGLATVKTD